MSGAGTSILSVHTVALGSTASTKQAAIAEVAFGIVGWVLNIRKLIDMGGMEASPVTWEGVVRVVGIFLAPLGSVLGFL